MRQPIDQLGWRIINRPASSVLGWQPQMPAFNIYGGGTTAAELPVGTKRVLLDFEQSSSPGPDWTLTYNTFPAALTAMDTIAASLAASIAAFKLSPPPEIWWLTPNTPVYRLLQDGNFERNSRLARIVEDATVDMLNRHGLMRYISAVGWYAYPNSYDTTGSYTTKITRQAELAKRFGLPTFGFITPRYTNTNGSVQFAGRPTPIEYVRAFATVCETFDSTPVLWSGEATIQYLKDYTTWQDAGSNPATEPAFVLADWSEYATTPVVTFFSSDPRD